MHVDTMLLILSAVSFSVSLATTNGMTQEDQCTERCTFCDIPSVGVFRTGESWVDEIDPCVHYVCRNGTIERMVEECQDQFECSDKKAPFYIEGKCCMQCLEANIPQTDHELITDFSEWSPWTKCSRSCGRGRRSRSRTCNIKNNVSIAFLNCKGELQEIEDCNIEPCPSICTLSQPCFPEVECIPGPPNTDEFSCGACPPGFTGDGIRCRNVNECKFDDACFEGVTCTDRMGGQHNIHNSGYTCGKCPPGYRGEAVSFTSYPEAQQNPQVCEDINECDDPSTCYVNVACKNIPGSYKCTGCMTGYVRSSNPRHPIKGPFCIVEDPCKAGTHTCGDHSVCQKTTFGRHKCVCPVGFIGDPKIECLRDFDSDGIPDNGFQLLCSQNSCPPDNCPKIYNPRQEDYDGDTIGDICDDDLDGDGIPNEQDNCPRRSNRLQIDFDNDGVGDACDNCITVVNTDQTNMDQDNFGDVCDIDKDGDGIKNIFDNCPNIWNPGQYDYDGDRIGDDCDNCVFTPNVGQRDLDYNGVGDACDSGADSDNDGILDRLDNCRYLANADQCDSDRDRIGDECDYDDDNDGVEDSRDNCRLVFNPLQEDSNSNNIGDACEGDMDGDGTPDEEDVFPNNSALYQANFRRYTIVKLHNGRQYSHGNPKWHVNTSGIDVQQMRAGNPSFLLAEPKFGNVDFSGEVEVVNTQYNNFIGFVVGFQSSKKFILISWKKTDETYRARRPFVATASAGLVIKAIDTTFSPGPHMRNMLFSSSNYKTKQKILFKDSTKKAWHANVPCNFTVHYMADTGCINVKVTMNGDEVINSGCSCTSQIKGGRLGLYSFLQPGIKWKNLRFKELKNEDMLPLKRRTCTKIN